MQSSPTQAQQSGELLIHNGLIVNEDGRMEADVRIRGEKIVEIGPKLVAMPGAREIDASGMLLLPGIVDTHTHLNLEPIVPPNPKGNADDLTSGSAAALAGGITTMSDFIRIENNEDPNAYADRVIGAIHKYSVADMFIHVSITPLSVPGGVPRTR
jgi:dihydropyrimidinase